MGLQFRMTALAMEIHLRLTGCNSLKEKRHRIRPIMEKLRNRFRASVAEIGDNELWGNAVIGIAIVGSNETLAREAKARVIEFLESNPEIEILIEMSEIVIL